jgi:methionine synthase II (cobalamin-independent)
MYSFFGQILTTKSRSPSPGPLTMTHQTQNDRYDRRETLALDYAAAVNEESKDLFAADIDLVQIDEPYRQAGPEKAREYGLAALSRALEGAACIRADVVILASDRGMKDLTRQVAFQKMKEMVGGAKLVHSELQA